MKKLGDRLAEIDSLIDWEVFAVAGMHKNNTEKGGRRFIFKRRKYLVISVAELLKRAMEHDESFKEYKNAFWINTIPLTRLLMMWMQRGLLSLQKSDRCC